MKDKELMAKMLNMKVTDKNFVDKDLDEYIYASLSQPPIKIIDKNNSNEGCREKLCYMLGIKD